MEFEKKIPSLDFGLIIVNPKFRDDPITGFSNYAWSKNKQTKNDFKAGCMHQAILDILDILDICFVFRIHLFYNTFIFLCTCTMVVYKKMFRIEMGAQ